jgi:hypothetical protein
MSDELVNQCIAELQDLVRCRCHPAYTGRGLHDPDCECDSAEAVRVVTDRIEDLEAKLAKAVEHIEWFISEDETNRGDEPMSSHGGRTWDEINEYWITHLDSAIAFVAELKGETDE